MAICDWTSGTCGTGDSKIHYVRTGRMLPPIVLLHGLGGNGACWTPLARSLENEFDVVMPDARGHGLSDSSIEGFRYEGLAGDVLSLIEGLELVAPVLLGHSMGGMTAAVIAGNVGEAISAVILADPTFLSPKRQHEVYGSGAKDQHSRLLGMDKEEALAEARTHHPRRTSEIVELLVEARMRTRIAAFDVLAPPSPDYHELVCKIAVPAFLIVGDSGSVVSIEEARELQRLNPNIRIAQIQDAGHGLQYDQPERFAELVRSFLRSIAVS